MEPDSPNPLLQPYVPDGFEAFWQALWESVRNASLSYSRAAAKARDLPHHQIETIDFQGVSGMVLHGWIAIPRELQAEAPAFLWIPAYGRWSHLPDPYSTREGFVSLSFNVHGLPAFHEEAYRPERGYFADGIESPDTWVMKRIIQDVFLAVRILADLPETDGHRLCAAGLSQGGGMALWAGAWCPLVQCVVADMPFLSSMRSVFSKPIYRYPLKEVVDFSQRSRVPMERILHTISYFDTVNQATRCRVPTQVSCGLKDPAVRPETARAVYEHLAATQKRFVEYPGGHDWDPDMLENNREWMNLNLSLP